MKKITHGDKLLITMRPFTKLRERVRLEVVGSRIESSPTTNKRRT